MSHENDAEDSTRYFNAQLSALWQNAELHVNKYESESKPDTPQQYSFIFRKFWFGEENSSGLPSKDDYMFYATFGTPSLEFFCNHELFLHLALEDGHYNTEFFEALDSRIATPHFNEQLPAVKVSLRIPFRFQTVNIAAARVGRGDNTIRLLVLDMLRAEVVDTSLVPEPGRRALTAYLQAYMRTLQAAGHHVFYDLPQCSDLDRQDMIDYFTSVKDFKGLNQLYGVSVERITKYLFMSWRKATLLAGSSETSDAADESHAVQTDYSRAVLADYKNYKSNRSDNFELPFHLKFGVPKVSVLCSEEVVFTLRIDELLCYDPDDLDCDPTHSFNGWELAFLVNVQCEKSGDGGLLRCRLDRSRLRYVEELSKSPGLESDQHQDGLFTSLINSLVDDYFAQLETSGCHIIFDNESLSQNSVNMAATDQDDTRGISIEARWKEVVEASEMHGFDMVTAISQRAINTHFKSLWESSKGQSEDVSNVVLSFWRYETCFEGNFEPITVRLLSRGAAIIWVRLVNGSLKTLNNRDRNDEGVEFRFSKLQLAFEVPLQEYANRDIPGDRPNLKATSPIYGDHLQNPDCDLRHVCLNLTDARFLLDLSQLDSLVADDMRQPVDRVHAMLTYVREHYFQELMSYGHHVLHTMPVWKSSPAHLSFALTVAKFQIHSESEITSHTFTDQSYYKEPVVIITGMTGNKPLPVLDHNFVTWVSSAARLSSQGVACLSADVFMRSRLLNALASVNAATTLIPAFIKSQTDGDQWPLKLVSWSKHPVHQGEASAFVFQPGSTSPLRYEWRHKEDFANEHSGSIYPANEKYMVSSETANMLEIQTMSKSGSLEIKLSGTVHVTVSFTSNGVETASKSSVAWGLALDIRSQGSSLNTNVRVIKSPHYESPKGSAGLSRSPRVNAEALLRRNFGSVPNLDVVLDQFKVFDGHWTACYPGQTAFTSRQPVFNGHGDLLLELRDVRRQSSPLSATSRSAHPKTPQSSSASPGRRSTQSAHMGRDGTSSPSRLLPATRRTSDSARQSPASSPHSREHSPSPRPYSRNQSQSRPGTPSRLTRSEQTRPASPQTASPIASRPGLTNITPEGVYQTTTSSTYRSATIEQSRTDLEVKIPGEPNGRSANGRDPSGKAAAARSQPGIVPRR